MSATKHLDPRDELSRVQRKRKALQQVFRITEAVERLYSGLESVLVLDEPAIRLPAQALTAFNDLSGKTQMLSKARLVKSLEAVDADVRRNLAGILDLVDEAGRRVDELEGGESAPMEDQAAAFIQGFRRKAQTAVALRVLLHKRGVGQVPQASTIPKQELTKRLQDLVVREQVCRKRIKEGVTEFRNDTAKILANQEIPGPIKDKVREVVKRLEEELRELEAGIKADGRSLQLETVILHAKDFVEEPEAPTKEAEPEPEPDLEPEEDHPQGIETPHTEQLGFWRRLRLWLMSPWSVSWRGLRKPPPPTDNS